MNKNTTEKIPEILTGWYQANKRSLPWRETKNPYFIWLSEIILQQTRIAQGITYYQKFIKNYPDILALANAPLDEIMKNWQGLGYYSRARNLHKTAKLIVEKQNSMFPGEYKKLLELPGIGPYTAAAIASIAFNQPYAVVDGNVSRVIARLYHIKTPINSTQGKKQFQQIASKLIQFANPSDFNQAMMDFGATLCTPLNPSCQTCPLQKLCQAFIMDKTDSLPVKTPSKKQKKRFFYYFFLEKEGFTYLHQRKNNDIWHSLFEFPLIETKSKKSVNELSKTQEWEDITGKQQTYTLINTLPLEKHPLTHQMIYAWLIHLRIHPDHNPGNNYIKIPLTKLHLYPVSKLTENFIEKIKLNPK